MPRGMCGSENEEGAGKRKLHNGKHHNFNFSFDIVKIIKSKNTAGWSTQHGLRIQRGS